MKKAFHNSVGIFVTARGKYIVNLPVPMDPEFGYGQKEHEDLVNGVKPGSLNRWDR